jgi:hypothetical protein
MAFTPLPYSGGGYWERMADLNLRGSEQQAANIRQNWQNIGSILPQTLGAVQDLAQQEQQRKYYATVQERQKQQLNQDLRSEALSRDMERGFQHYMTDNGIDFAQWKNDLKSRKGQNFEGPTREPRLDYDIESSPGAVMAQIQPLEQKQLSDQIAIGNNIKQGKIDLVNLNRVKIDKYNALIERHPEMTEGQRRRAWRPVYDEIISSIGSSPGSEEIASFVPNPMDEAWTSGAVQGLGDFARTYADLGQQSILRASNLQNKSWLINQTDEAYLPDQLELVREMVGPGLAAASNPEEVQAAWRPVFTAARNNEELSDALRATYGAGTEENPGLNILEVAEGGMDLYKTKIGAWISGEPDVVVSATRGMAPYDRWRYNQTGETKPPTYGTPAYTNYIWDMDQFNEANGLPTGNFQEYKKRMGVHQRMAENPSQELDEAREKLREESDRISDLADVTRGFVSSGDLEAINSPESKDHLFLYDPDTGSVMTQQARADLFSRVEEAPTGSTNEIQEVINFSEDELKKRGFENTRKLYNVGSRGEIQSAFLDWMSQGEVLEFIKPEGDLFGDIEGVTLGAEALRQKAVEIFNEESPQGRIRIFRNFLQWANGLDETSLNPQEAALGMLNWDPNSVLRLFQIENDSLGEFGNYRNFDFFKHGIDHDPTDVSDPWNTPY